MSDTITPTAGIDTGKDKLDIAIHGQTTHFIVPNDATGWVRLAREFSRLGIRRAGIEATGGYERGVCRHLTAAGIAVILLQPMQVKAYAKMHLKRAKNDRIDAGLIAACTAALDETARAHAPDPRIAAMSGQLTFVEQLEEDIVRGKTRLEHTHDKRLRGELTKTLARLKAQRDGELRRIAATLRKQQDLAKRFELVLSVPGIGERTAIALLVRLPELGTIDREKAASLAGLAPFDADSSTHRGERHIAGGRARLRRSLYAAALPAAFRWNAGLKALYARLTARGKPHKVALVACARKLLVYANTVVERGTPWKINTVAADATASTTLLVS
jgi:transposase